MEIEAKQVRIVALDLPRLWSLAYPGDEFTARMLAAVDAMMLSVLAAVARRDHQDCRRRQTEGTARAKAAGVYKGRRENAARSDDIATMLPTGSSWQQIQGSFRCNKGTIAKVRMRLNTAMANQPAADVSYLFRISRCRPELELRRVGGVAEVLCKRGSLRDKICKVAT